MRAQSSDGSFDTESSLDDASWQQIKAVISEMPVQSAELRESVIAGIQGQDFAVATSESVSVPKRRTVASTNRLAATVASLTAMLVLSISLSGLLDEPSRHVRVAGAELMASILKTSEDDWQVVVVKVPEESQTKIRNSISTSALNTGMDVHSVDTSNAGVSSRQPDLFISSADSAATVLQIIDQATGGVRKAEVVDMDRERLLSCFVESMQSPTASEKYFGQMLIVQRDSLKLDARKIASNNVGRTELGPRNKPILVVLTSKEVASLGPQGAIKGGGLPVAVVL